MLRYVGASDSITTVSDVESLFQATNRDEASVREVLQKFSGEYPKRTEIQTLLAPYASSADVDSQMSSGFLKTDVNKANNPINTSVPISTAFLYNWSMRSSRGSYENTNSGSNSGQSLKEIARVSVSSPYKWSPLFSVGALTDQGSPDAGVALAVEVYYSGKWYEVAYSESNSYAIRFQCCTATQWNAFPADTSTTFRLLLKTVGGKNITSYSISSGSGSTTPFFAVFPIPTIGK